jgi:hypothetical protein
LPDLRLLKGRADALLVVYLSVYGILVEMRVLHDADVELELVLGHQNVYLGPNSQTDEICIRLHHVHGLELHHNSDGASETLADWAIFYRECILEGEDTYHPML